MFNSRLLLILLINLITYSCAFVASSRTICHSARTVYHGRPFEMPDAALAVEDFDSKSNDVSNDTKWKYINFKVSSRTLLVLSLILPLVVENLWLRKIASSIFGISLARICSNQIHNRNTQNMESVTEDRDDDLHRKKRQQMSVRKRFLGGIGVRKILADLEEQDRRIDQINREILQAREKERLEEGKQWAIKSIHSTKEAQRKAQERLRKEEADRRKAKAWAASITKTSGVDITQD